MISVRMQASLFFIVSLVLFTVGLSHQEIIGFESRFYLFALEMWRHGPSIFPTTYQSPYPDYPATGTFLIYLCSKVMGGLTKFSAVLPSAIASSITLSTTYLIGALHSRRWGVCAALFLMFTATFLMAARSLSLDPYIAMITTISFYLIYSDHKTENKGREKWIFLLLILGFAFRGPLGLVIPTSVICVFYLLDKNIKQFFIFGFLSGLLLIVCCITLFGLAYYEGGIIFLQDVLRMQVLGRMQHDSQTLPFYFYFKESLGSYAISFPLAILVLLGLFSKKNITPEIKFLQKLAAWVIIILIGLSIPADKKIRYILPIAPALALICGYLFTVEKEEKYLYALRQFFYKLCLIFPALCVIAIVFGHFFYPVLKFPLYSVLGVLLALQLLIFFVWRRDVIVLALAAMAFVASYSLVVEKINLNLNRTRDFVGQVESFRSKEHSALVFYKEGMDGLVIKYLVNMQNQNEPYFASDLAALNAITMPAMVIARESHFAELSKDHVEVLFKGKIGHKGVVVFKLKE